MKKRLRNYSVSGGGRQAQARNQLLLVQHLIKLKRFDYDAEKIVELLRAENVSVESYWPGLFAKLCEKKNLDELIMNIGAAATDEKLSVIKFE
ncbi:60S acidic ribosomal protein P1 [Artemisia annua]|uniref:60S acidic ribosomal protein P1 n=1 Tax=Artemisia annua TaxID=35608 RepID=A0A2U1MNZ9_ARTAN|nr:60S acidic ribosomal protein P1 [Artemisia annua]